MDQRQGPRERLLEAALRVIAAEGPEAVQARRLTAEIGVSTMAVYTHFGGMPGLMDAVVREGLRRFADHVRARAPDTEDPVADLFAGGLAYGEWAVANAQLYRLIFGITSAGRFRPWSHPEGNDAFSVLLRSVERTIEAGRLRRQDPVNAAAQILASTHGFLLLGMGGFVEDSGQDPGAIMAPLAVNLMVGLGDDREAAERSFAAAIARARS